MMEMDMNAPWARALLAKKPAVDAAAELARIVSGTHPDDDWVRFETPPRPDGAIYTVLVARGAPAIALREFLP
jgi:hypothetical protein